MNEPKKLAVICIKKLSQLSQIQLRGGRLLVAIFLISAGTGRNYNIQARHLHNNNRERVTVTKMVNL